MSFRFERLDIWQMARQFCNEIYIATKHFPPEEKYNLTNQIRRAGISIVANIAEGSDRKSDKEFVRFLRMSLSSLEEVVAELYVSMDQTIINKNKFDSIYLLANNLAARINALINKIKQ